MAFSAPTISQSIGPMREIVTTKIFFIVFHCFNYRISIQHHYQQAIQASEDKVGVLRPGARRWTKIHKPQTDSLLS